MTLSPEQQLELIRANTIDLIPEDELLAKLRSGRPLRVKLGVDPTGPDIHLGHAVVLRKLRFFQDLGHTAVLIIGDFTGLIGDPSGRNEGRPQLTREQVEKNVSTYREQVFKILDPEKTEFHYNSEWLSKLTPEHIIRLAATHTVNQLLAREDFRARYTDNQPISLHEFLYPLLQGYDSVAIRADIELGGTEQKFNMLVGRDLQVECTHPLLRFLGRPSSETWSRVVHAGASLESLRDGLEQCAKQGAEYSVTATTFLGKWSPSIHRLLETDGLAPSFSLPHQMMTDLREVLRDDISAASPPATYMLTSFKEPQCIITFPILVGTDGVRRMGKSLNNYIGVNDPPDDMFGKVMSIPDNCIQQYFELCTDVPQAEVAQMVAEMKAGALNPRDAKRRLGREIVTLYHSAEAAKAADETFLRVFSTQRQQTRADYEAVAAEVAIPADLRGKPVWISTALAQLGLAKSKGEATRLVKGGGVYLDERRISDPQEEVALTPGMLLRVGKRKVARLA